MWPHADAWLDQLADSLGYTQGAEVRLQAATVYRRLVRAAKGRMVDNLVQSRLSSFPSGEDSMGPPPPAPVKRGGVVRTFGPASGSAGVLDFHTTTATIAADPRSREMAAKELKLDQLFTILMEYVIRPDELGIMPAYLQDPVGRQSVKEMVLHGAARLSLQRLGSLVSSFRRWVRYCQTESIDPRSRPFHPWWSNSSLQHACGIEVVCPAGGSQV